MDVVSQLAYNIVGLVLRGCGKKTMTYLHNDYRSYALDFRGKASRGKNASHTT
jgi:hypothetical protein